MTTSATQEAVRAAVARDLATVRAVLDTIGPRDAAALVRPPAAGGWSAAQVLEHLVVAHDAYAARLRARLADPALPSGAPTSRWSPTLAGRLLRHAMTSTRRMPAPKAWRVDAVAPRAGVPGALSTRLDELEGMMAQAAYLEWRRVRLSSPVAAIVRLNLGDCFVILAAHARRHAGQLERALAEARAAG